MFFTQLIIHNMLIVIITILGISLLLYTLLGGADFGAGIVEIFTGKKSINTISKAIAPVWEANHIWLILAIVILFNGFPKVYTQITTYLHIPILLILIGITARGTAFTFRYYDAVLDRTHNYYTTFFRISSLLTPFFIGVTLGATLLGRLPTEAQGTFYQLYLYPWCNFFTLATGIFITVLFGWLAAVFLTGEAKDKKTFKLIKKTAAVLYILLIISGITIFVTGEYYKLHLVSRFIHSYLSIASLLIATLIIPTLWNNISLGNSFWSRFLAGTQTVCIMTGWFTIQFPVMVYTLGGNHLTVWNSAAPERTIYFLFIALLVGIVLIFPSIIYLLFVFKSEAKTKLLSGMDEIPLN